MKGLLVRLHLNLLPQALFATRLESSCVGSGVVDRVLGVGGESITGLALTGQMGYEPFELAVAEERDSEG